MPEVRSAGICGAVVLYLVSLAGCSDRETQNARQEAAEAKATISRLEASLAIAKREIVGLKEELGAVRETRDELHNQIAQWSQERDRAIALAEQTRQTVKNLSARSDGQAGAVGVLQNQVRQLETVIKSQQATIEQQRAAIAEQRSVIEELQKSMSEQQENIREQPAGPARVQPEPSEPNQAGTAGT